MPFSRGQKVFFLSALLVVALSALGLSARRFLRGLAVAPVGVLPQVATSNKATPLGTNIETLQARDTDSDGLSDAEELFRYGTSPYLKDTDSDGIGDGEEIRRATNPLCPEGKTCTPEGILFGGLSSASQSPLSIPPVLPVPTQAASGSAGAGTSAPQSIANVETPEVLARLLSGQASAQELRAFLKRQGAREEDLAGIDDQTLFTLYTQAVAQALGGTAAPAPSAQQPTP